MHETIIRYTWVKDLINTNGLSNIVIWSDQGLHFMNSANLYFWLIDLMYNYEWISTVTYNFFIAKLGKSLCDGHFGQLNYYYNIYVKTNEVGVHNTQQLSTAILQGYNQAQRVRQHRHDNLNHDRNYEQVQDPAEVRCVNFDFSIDNQHQSTLLQSKEDNVHIQYALIWKDKISSFGCYKIVRDLVDDTDRNAYVAHTTDPKYHNHIGYGSYGPVFALKNRYDFDETHAQLGTELSHAEYRQSTGHKHKILVSAYPYQSYPEEFKSVEMSLGVSIVMSYCP